MRWNSDEQFKNTIYVGRACDSSGNCYHYIGQSKNPARRWDNHLQQKSGPYLFGENVEWAILAWNVPAERMDAAESYMIGYVLRRFGCINGNRGKDVDAFAKGYRDAGAGIRPAICVDIDMDTLDWQEVGFIDAFVDGVVDGVPFASVTTQRGQVHVSEKSDIPQRYWGFHTLDRDRVVEEFVKHEKARLEQLMARQRALNEKLENKLSVWYHLWLIAGIAVGVAATLWYAANA